MLYLFDKELPVATRNEMARRLLIFTPPTVFQPGKPKFPKHLLDATTAIDLNLDLLKCIGPCSLLLFHLLGKKDEQLDLLHCSVENWDNTTGFRKIEEIVRGFEVMNDCADCGVKALSNIKDATQDKDQQHYLLQVIERHRKLVPTITKANFKNFLNYCAQEWI